MNFKSKKTGKYSEKTLRFVENFYVLVLNLKILVF